MGSRGPLPAIKTPVIFEAGVPDPSARLDELARDEYCRARDLCKAAGRELQQVDFAVLELYASAFSDYWFQDAAIRKEGSILTLSNGVLASNPRCRLRDQAGKQLLAAAARLGFSPADRARVSDGRTKMRNGKPNPLDEFG